MYWFIILQTHLILQLRFRQPEVTQRYEMVTHYCFFRLYNTMQRKVHLELTWNYFLSIIRFVYTASPAEIVDSFVEQNLSKLPITEPLQNRAILPQIPEVKHRRLKENPSRLLRVLRSITLWNEQCHRAIPLHKQNVLVKTMRNQQGNHWKWSTVNFLTLRWQFKGERCYDREVVSGLLLQWEISNIN